MVIFLKNLLSSNNIENQNNSHAYLIPTVELIKQSHSVLITCFPTSKQHKMREELEGNFREQAGVSEKNESKI